MIAVSEKNRVYACVVSRKDYLVHKQTGQFDLDHYTAHPEEYESLFAEKVVIFRPYFIWERKIFKSNGFFFFYKICQDFIYI